MKYRPISSVDVAAGASSAKSDAAPSSTRAVMVTALSNDVRCALGAEPVATATSILIPAGRFRIFQAAAGDKVAAIQNSAAGTLNVVWLV